ncbi:hypothetical protein Tco_0957122 [Tanacetum coccineum]
MYRFHSISAKCSVQQNIAATRGLAALKSVNNMYVVGEVNMVQGQVNEDCQDNAPSAKDGSESGACMLWQKSPYLELVVSGWRLKAGHQQRGTRRARDKSPSKLN